MMLYQNGRKFAEYKYKLENELEKDIVASSQTLFGEDTIYIDAKRKISSESLGNSIPDGFLFDLSDIENPEFFLVEVELASHDFFKHIFPQITKFFAFFKNNNRQKELVQKLFSVIDTDATLKKQFKKYLGETEIFKFLNDVIDGSQNILLILDADKPEMPEIIDTYSDTWGKMVKVLTAKKYIFEKEYIFAVHPEFETIEYSYQEPTFDNGMSNVSEEFHLEGVRDNVKQAYSSLKSKILAAYPTLVFHPTKHRISIKARKNLAYIDLGKTRLRIVIMMSEVEMQPLAGNLTVKMLSQAVQNYYNGPCAALNIVDPMDIDVVVKIIRRVVDQSNSAS